MLQGDLTKFSAGDLLSFLAHMNQEGVLTVTQDGQVLNLCFRGGLVTGADSDQADAKTLDALLRCGALDSGQHATLRGARQDTGVPLADLLRVAEGLDLGGATAAFELGVREVVYQLFSWDRGRFQFNEMPAPEGFTATAWDSTALSMDAARQVDEVREFLRGAGGGESILARTGADAPAPAAAPEIEPLLAAADAGWTVGRALADAPLTTHQAMKALVEAIGHGWIVLRGTESEAAAPSSGDAGSEALFLSFRRCQQKLLTCPDKRAQIAELLAYCREHFPTFLLIALQGRRLVRCRRFRPGVPGERRGVELPDPRAEISGDFTFRSVLESRAPFFGRIFESPVLQALGHRPQPGECALIPLGGRGDEHFLLFVESGEAAVTPGPLHFLELISLQIHSPAHRTTPGTAGAEEAEPHSGQAPDPVPAAAAGEPAPADLVAAVNELPSMPHVVSRVLELLSDPDHGTADLVRVLSPDPSLVARLVRVSNSALYGRGQETRTLDQAVVRLGTNTVRSLVMATSMRSLFPLEKSRIGAWGQSLWEHSLECGLATRAAALASRHPDPEAAFVAGVLHDIGKVVILLNRPEDYGRVLREQGPGWGDSVDAERVVLGFDHTEVGQLLLGKWQLPASLQAVARGHHDREPDAQADPDVDRLRRLVAVGDLLSHRSTHGEDGSFEDLETLDRLCEGLGIGPDAVENLLREAGVALEASGLLD